MRYKQERSLLNSKSLKTFPGIWILILSAFLSGVPAFAQTTNGLMTGVITDPSGALISQAQITVTNQGTGVSRTTVSDSKGYYIVPQLAPGIYSVSVKMAGFASENRAKLQLQVNQSLTLDFALPISSTSETIQVTDTPPQLNTTSSTLGDVIGHAAIVDLPLDGRQFTQLTLLTPGAVPSQAGQQTANLVSLGAGGISPAVNGQRPRQNNYTMDGVLNNYIFADTWSISPPPDALQEFNVQSHITDAQFAISSGANINIVSRSGTNSFHGAAWEFIRNDALDAQTFPETARLPYKQNQYGVFFGGPVLFPHFNGKNNTWFSAYWEGFRSDQSQTALGDTLTPAMLMGDFSALLGAQVGTDSLGRPEFAGEIYDPLTSRTDPTNPSAIIRDPFPMNKILPTRLNAASLLVAQKYYPAPNLNVAANVLPNISFVADTTTASDQAGIRVDHRFSDSDNVFFRYNRSNINAIRPGALPGEPVTATEYAQSYAAGYTHLFGLNTILNIHYGYSNDYLGRGNTPAGVDFSNSIGFGAANPPHDGITFGPNITMGNGYGGVAQTIVQNGPMNGSDYHADLSKIIGRHTLGIGGMYYHIHAVDDGWQYTVNFTQNATSQGALATTTGLSPASFLLGLPDSYAAILGDSSANQTLAWYAGYVQDEWQVTKKLAVTAGLRWDYITPPNYHKIISSLNPLNGQFLLTGAVPPTFLNATAPPGLFNPQYNGFEPRLGMTYAAGTHTVIHAAFAMLDDHNNNLVQKNQGPRVSWPTAVQTSVATLNRSQPTTFFNQLPSASSFLTSLPLYVAYGINPDDKIPYSVEYNTGIEQQLTSTLVLNADYVGSIGRHQFIDPQANTATTPGPGTLASRGQPFSQYGGPFVFEADAGNASYNSFQAKLKQSVTSGLYFLASYTWSKSLDTQSDAASAQIQNIYKMSQDWGPSDFDRRQMFVFSGVYALPIGRDGRFLTKANRFVQAAIGGWSIGGIVSMYSGAPFNAVAGGDVANVGGGTQRALVVGPAYSGPGFKQTPATWVNKASFKTPVQYTFGNEGRNDLVGPSFKNVDFTGSKSFPITKGTSLQFRAELFNFLNHTNYGTPTANVQSAAFGKITGTASNGRIIQFAAKVVF
jgi:hypothetical protein